MTQNVLFESGHRTMSRVELLFAIAEKMGYDICTADGCVEPGYADNPVVLGNWNNKKVYDRETGQSRVVDSTMPRLAKLFEKLGYEVEWEDEWGICDECGKAYRTQPDSYSWKRYHWDSPAGYSYCGDCIKRDPTDYLEWLNGNSNAAMTFDIDLSEHGYKNYNHYIYETGFHSGQNSNPKAVAKELRDKGITDFIFVIDSNGQFGCDWDCWIRKPESED
jgi:hypothetical protein